MQLKIGCEDQKNSRFCDEAVACNDQAARGIER